jgi:hypothetical protein
MSPQRLSKSPQRWTTTPAATILFPNPSRPRRRFLVVTRRLGGRRFLLLDLLGLADMSDYSGECTRGLLTEIGVGVLVVFAGTWGLFAAAEWLLSHVSISIQ